MRIGVIAMNDGFCTKDLNLLFDYIKVLLKARENEGIQLRIIPDCENVYMVDYCIPEYSGESFELFNETNNILCGHKIEFVCGDEET